MAFEPLNLAVIVASTREGRRATVVADWLLGEIKSRSDFDVDLVDLTELDLPLVHPAHINEAHAAYSARMERADAFVVVTPEYNHSYPASVKHAVDILKAPWYRKAVAFVSYGGVSGGLRAVEHLRGVFAELHAVTVRESVSFHGPWNFFTPDGQPGDPVSARQAAAVMLDDLAWWASALRTARSADVSEQQW